MAIGSARTSIIPFIHNQHVVYKKRKKKTKYVGLTSPTKKDNLRPEHVRTLNIVKKYLRPVRVIKVSTKLFICHVTFSTKNVIFGTIAPLFLVKRDQ